MIAAEFTSAQIGDMLAYHSLYPSGPARDDERAGTVARVVYNMSRGEDQPARDWTDFFPPPRLVTEEDEDAAEAEAERVQQRLSGWLLNGPVANG